MFAEMDLDIMALLNQFGFPVALLIVLIIFARKAAIWSAENIVQPIIASHTDLMKSIKMTNEKNTQVNEQNSETLKKISEANEQKKISFSKIAESTEATRIATEKTNNRLDCLCLQTAEQSELVFNAVKVVSEKAGVPCPVKPPVHNPCGD